jgi:hypothetical protein
MAVATDPGHQELAEMDCEKFWRLCVDIPTGVVSYVGSFEQ